MLRRFVPRLCSVAQRAAEEPPRRLLRYHFLVSALPMVGFGFMDNTIMIRSGDLIDNTVGEAFGLSTLTAAACGQALSDVCGVTFGTTIEEIAASWGLHPVTWTGRQGSLRSVRLLGTAGAATGVFLGCCLGMTNLLFMDLGARERTEKAKELKTIFATVVDSSKDLLNTELATIWLMGEDGKTLWTTAGTNLGERMLTREINWEQRPEEATSLTVACVLDKKELVVQNCYADSRFNRENDKRSNFVTHNMLCIPILNDAKDKVLGVVQFVNKRGMTGKDYADFNANDAKLAKMMAHHVAIFLAQAK